MKKIKEIRLHQRPVGLLSKLLNEIGTIFIYFLQKYNFSPNYFTFMSLVSAIAGSYCIYINNFYLSAIFFIFWYIFDVMDGQWARLKNKSSLFGKLLDGITDRISLAILSLTLFLYILKYNINPLFSLGIMLFLLGLYINYFINYLSYDIVNFDKIGTAPEDNKQSTDKKNNILYIMINIGKNTVKLFYHDKVLLILIISLILNNIKIFILYLGINGLYLIFFGLAKIYFIYIKIQNEKK